MQGFQVPLIAGVLVAVTGVSTGAPNPTALALANAQAQEYTLKLQIIAKSVGHKCNVGDDRHDALVRKHRAATRMRTRTARVHNVTHERHVAPIGCRCDAYDGDPTNACGSDYNEYADYCPTTAELIAEETCAYGGGGVS